MITNIIATQINNPTVMMPKQGTLPHTRHSKHGRGGGDTAWAPLRGAAAATRTRPRGDGGGAAQYSLNRRCRRRRRLREYFKVVMLPEVNSCTMRPQLSPLVRRMRATTTCLAHSKSKLSPP